MLYSFKQRLFNRGIPNGWETQQEMFEILNDQGNTNQSYFEIPSYTFYNGKDQPHKWYLMSLKKTLKFADKCIEIEKNINLSAVYQTQKIKYGFIHSYVDISS